MKKKIIVFNFFFFLALFLLLFIFHNPPEGKSVCVGPRYCLKCCPRCWGGIPEDYCATQCASLGTWTGYPLYGTPCNEPDDNASTCAIRIGLQ